MPTIICGGRKYTMTPFDWMQLDMIHFGSSPEEAILLGPDAPAGPLTCVYEGEANGADLCGKAWARSRDVDVLGFPASWRPDPDNPALVDKAAGKRRNADMRDGRHPSGPVTPPELVIATRGGSGTRDMVDKMQAAGRRVFHLRTPWQRWYHDDIPFLRRGLAAFQRYWFERGAGGPVIVSAHELKLGQRIFVPEDIPCVYCGRGSLSRAGHSLPGSNLLGNPYRILRRTGRRTVEVLYEPDGTTAVLSGRALLVAYRARLRERVRSQPELRRLLAEQISPCSVLICWCSARSACHATVIADAAMQLQAAAWLAAHGRALPAKNWKAYRI